MSRMLLLNPTGRITVDRRRGVICWEMNAGEAEDLAEALDAAFPYPDLSWLDAARLRELAEEIRQYKSDGPGIAIAVVFPEEEEPYGVERNE